MPTDFHIHWYWDREDTPLPLLNPLQVRGPGKNATKHRVTGRVLSVGEVQPGKRPDKCSLCGATGHKRNSQKCPVKLQATIVASQQELEDSIERENWDQVGRLRQMEGLHQYSQSHFQVTSQLTNSNSVVSSATALHASVDIPGSSSYVEEPFYNLQSSDLQHTNFEQLLESPTPSLTPTNDTTALSAVVDCKDLPMSPLKPFITHNDLDTGADVSPELQQIRNHLFQGYTKRIAQAALQVPADSDRVLRSGTSHGK